MTVAKFFERKPTPATRKTFEQLSSLGPLDKDLQVLWLGSTLNVDVPIDAITKDLVWGSTKHECWLLFIPTEWFIDATLERNLKEQEDLTWIVVEAPSCLVTTPPQPYRQSNLPNDWWYPFLAWNGSTTVEQWLRIIKHRLMKRSASVSRQEILEGVLRVLLNNCVPSNPIQIIKLYEILLLALFNHPNKLRYKEAFYEFLEIISQKNPTLGHLLVKSHGFADFLQDEKGTTVLEDISSKRYQQRKALISIHSNHP